MKGNTVIRELIIKLWLSIKKYKIKDYNVLDDLTKMHGKYIYLHLIT